MIDFNASEILVLAVLAVIVFGPEKLPELARKAARVLNYVRNIANDAQGRLREELGPEFSELQLTDLNPKALLASNILAPVQAEVASVKAEVSSVRSELRSDIEQLQAATTEEADIEIDDDMVEPPEFAGPLEAGLLVSVVPYDTEAT